MLREHEGAGGAARPPQLAGHHPAAARPAVADRDLLARLEEIELQQLAGAIDGALIGALGAQDRPQFAQGVIEDRLAAPIARLGDQLADAGVRDPVDVAQQPGDLLAVGVELRGNRRAAVARRLGGADRPADRLAIPPGLPRDLLDRQPIDEVHAADLRPLLHCDQLLLLLASASLTEPGCVPRRTVPEGGQFSTGQG